MQPATKEKDTKMRVFTLAKELTEELKREIRTKEILDHCKQLGFTGITNQFHGLEAEQVQALREHLKSAPKAAPAVAEPPPPPRPTVLPPPGKLDSRIQTLPKPKSAKPVQPAAETQPTAAAEPPPTAAEAVGVQPLQQVQPGPTAAAAPPEQAPAAAAASDVAASETAAKLPPEAAPSAAAESSTPTAPPPAAPPQNIIPPQFVLGTGRPMNLSGNRPVNLSRPANVPPRPTQPLPPRSTQPPPRPGPPPAGSKPAAVTGSTTPQAGSKPPASGSTPPQTGSKPAASGYTPTPPTGTRPPQPPPPRNSLIGGKGAPQVNPPKSLPGQVKLTPEMLEKIRNMSQRGQRVDIRQVARTGDINPLPIPRSDRPIPPPTSRGGPRDADSPRGAGLTTVRPDRDHRGRPELDDEERKRKGVGGVIGRDTRHKARQTRGRNQQDPDRNAVIIGDDGSVDLIETTAGSRRGPRQAMLDKLRRRQQQAAIKKEGPVEISVPITVRSLSEAIGMKTGELAKRLLKETNKLYGNNSTVEFDVAELIAIEQGIQLVLKKQETAETRLLEAYEKRAREVDPALLVPRPPIVTVMGHVDHGKTSLLDRIRQEFGLQSDVVSTEAGGITQVIRAWQVEKDDRRITFLDTPGHEAFTKMRARGAKVTDIVVIVVAATDGVMPQTEEAINHALAAKVGMVVAINKIDMPNADVEKTRSQLYSRGILPDNMGGEVPFVETSAVTGEGISELLNTIIIMAELNEQLKADPSHPASGTCLEAYLQGQEGVMATLLVQQGTLRKGDVVLCGSSYGRVRAMYNDQGRLITEAGPSTPVKITGLDEVPDADDPFYAVESVSTAREIAEARKSLRQRAAQTSFAPVSLESLTAAKTKEKITELKVILKAEARGSVEAIRKELEKLVHDEVKCRVLHAGIGAITESDISLALTSPEDTMVIGFNVTADDAALKLAEARQIPIREYDIIYKLTEDVKAALEGKLKPVEEVLHLGRAVVREIFKISKVGTIAGCYVTSGVIERNARVRVLRQGVVVYPPGDKIVGLDNLKRFKDDVREVREGFECGMKISGFDDVKVDDVIEAFKIEVRNRTL